MAITFTDTPLMAIPDWGGDPITGISNLMAAHNPIRVKGRREDHPIKNTTNDGNGYVQIELNTLPIQVTVGKEIYVNSENIQGVYTVRSWSGAFIVINLAWVADTGPGYCNLLYDNYNYWIRVTCQATNGQDVVSDPVNNIITPFTDGTFEFDFSPFAKTQVSNQNPPLQLSTTNRFWYSSDYATLISGTFFENYADREKDESITFSCRVTNSAMSPYHYGGGNILECFGGGFFNGSRQNRFFMPKAKQRWYGDSPVREFITMWDPFSTTIANDTWYLRFRRFDVNGGALTTSLVACNKLGMVAGGSSGKKSYPHFINLDTPTMTTGTAEFGVSVVASNSEAAAVHSEEVIFRVSCLPRNPVYIRALNYYGGFNYFVFGVNQIKSLSTKKGTVFTTLNPNVKVIDNDDRLLSKDNQLELTLGADNLDNDDLINLRAILASPYVQIWSTYTDYAGTFPLAVNGLWQMALIADGSFNLGNSKVGDGMKAEIKIVTNAVNVQTS